MPHEKPNQDASSARLPRVPARSLIGHDGLSMLLLSLAVAMASAGGTFLIALWHVFSVAYRVPATAPSPRRILVLGMRSSADRLRQAYRARLDRAAALFSSDPDALIVILGGRTGDPDLSEAEIGKRYLVARGVPATRIELEEGSRHTLENLREYRATFADALGVRPVLVTSRFHMARCAMMANGLGMGHELCAAEDRLRLTVGQVALLAREAFFVHWYVVGRTYARWAGNREMEARIS